MGKKALKGFGNVKYFPLTANTAAAYTPANPGSALGVGARSCTASDTRNEYKIPGDDGIYDQGSEYESTELQISVNEMPLEALAALINVSRLMAAIKAAKERRAIADHPLSPKLFLEDMLLRYARHFARAAAPAVRK